MTRQIGLGLATAMLLLLTACKNTTPTMLDLTQHYTEAFPEPKSPEGSSTNLNGLQQFDGLPFAVRGRAQLYGKYDALGKDDAAFREKRPNLVGIPVGRKFEELHLLHTTRWPDAEGATIARVRLNYADGTDDELDIGYGVHTRDWQRLYTEADETLSDSNSKVVWRGPGREDFRSTQRMFKSTMINPQPKKRVETIDVISAENLAAYSLSAATVVNADPKRVLTPPVPQGRPEHNFDGRIVVRVLDENDQAVEGAWVDTGIRVPESSWYTLLAPHYTSAKGFAHVRYPTEWKKDILIGVRKDGFKTEKTKLHLSSPNGWKPGTTVTLRLKPKR